MKDLIPYKPGHVDAPKFRRKTKGIGMDNVGKPQKKRKDTSIVHNRFRAAHKDCSLKDAQLTAILRAFNENMSQAALENRAGVTLPVRMGRLEVVTIKKGKKKRIDDFVSKELGVVVHCSRNQGGGMYPLAQLNVYSDSYNMPNKYLWEYQQAPVYKKKMWRLFEQNRTQFVPAKKEYLDYYRREKFYKKEFAMKQSAELLLTYNEFEGII